MSIPPVERLGDKLDVRELRVQYRLRDPPADKRLGRTIGLKESQEAERAERLSEQADAQHHCRNGVDELPAHVGRRVLL